jgi:hypothetical protein
MKHDMRADDHRVVLSEGPHGRSQSVVCASP